MDRIGSRKKERRRKKTNGLRNGRKIIYMVYRLKSREIEAGFKNRN